MITFSIIGYLRKRGETDARIQREEDSLAMDGLTGFPTWRTKAHELHADLAPIVDIISDREVGGEVFNNIRWVEPANRVCLLSHRPSHEHLAFDTAIARGGGSCSVYIVDEQPGPYH